MTHRLLVFVSLLFVLFFVTGCPSPNRYEEINYYEGRHGLVFDFMDNSPAEKVYPEQVVPVSIDLHNAGAFDLARTYPPWYNGHELMPPLYATATLIYDDFYFTEDASSRSIGERTRNSIFLMGKSPYWPGGESRFLTLGLLTARDPGPNRMGADTDIKVSLCYPYETVLTTMVCVEGDPTSTRAGDCVAEVQSFSDQGAPVAVTSVETRSVPVRLEEVTVNYGNGPETVLQSVVRPMFKMTLRNVGGGQVIRGREFDQWASCLRTSENDLQSGTAVVYAYLGKTALKCTPSLPSLADIESSPGLVTFFDGEAEVLCSIPPSQDIMTSANYETTLQVYVDYVYQIRETVTVQIDDSLSAYVPPDFGEMRCSDFDADYANCRLYGDQHGGFFSNLNCFYCDELKKCLSGTCAQCPESATAYAPTRMCVGGCPSGLPSVSGSKSADGNTVELRCTDPVGTGANDHGRCGCGEFLYYSTATAEECTGAPFPTSGVDSVRGTYSAADRRTFAEVAVSSVYDGPEAEERYLCFVGVAGGVSGDEKLSKPRAVALHS